MTAHRTEPEQTWYNQKHPAPTLRAVRPLGSLTAAAQRVTRKRIRDRALKLTSQDWQTEAWDMYDLVGELWFLTNVIAARIGQARLYIGRTPDTQTDEPEKLDDTDPINALLDTIGGNAAGRSQLLTRTALNLAVSGEAWVTELPDTTEARGGTDSLPRDGGASDWQAFSVEELTTEPDGTITAKLSDSETATIDPETQTLIRVWRPHPRRAWAPDSAVKAALPVLRNLVGLTMHVSAQVDSRLAGAGLLFAPEEAQRALRAAAMLTGASVEDGDDPLAESLLIGMVTPIRDRESASAVVPIVVTVPGDTIEQFRHMSFATPLDAETRNLRDDEIRRLALSLDAPPEQLLGTGSMNHWGGWLVQQSTVSSHVAPPLGLICDALTTQYLWPGLVEQYGMTPEQAADYVVWFDVSHLIVRPNLSSDAAASHKAGVISDRAYRLAAGFEESDAPDIPGVPLEVQMAFDACRADPSLLRDPGLPFLIAEYAAALTGDLPVVDLTQPATAEPEPAAPADGGTDEPAGVVPDTDGNPAELPTP